MKGLVIKTVGNLYNVQVKDKIYKCNYRGKYKLSNNFSNPIVSGDIVEIIVNDEETGIIEEIYDRKNYFLKKSLKDNKAHIIASNIDQTLIMGSIKSPYTKLKFIDKCIAASLYYEIKPIVLFNKIDLLNKKEEKKLNEISSIYKNLNIEFISISIKKKINMDEVSKKLKNHKTLLIGNSGIGKSSLINFLTGVKNQRTDKKLQINTPPPENGDEPALDKGVISPKARRGSPKVRRGSTLKIIINDSKQYPVLSGAINEAKRILTRKNHRELREIGTDFDLSGKE